ncbi:8454_t:CDS:2, partial [Gigaspora rosea]
MQAQRDSSNENAKIITEKTKLEVKYNGLKARIVELEQTTKKNEELKVRIEELERNSTDTATENAELRDRVMKLEQKQARDQRSLISKISTTTNPSNPKSLEEIETDNFLDLESKNEVSNMIGERNREKKLLRGNEAPASQTQKSYNTSLTMPTPLILSKVSIFDGDNSSEVLLQSNGTNVPEPLDSKM